MTMKSPFMKREEANLKLRHLFQLFVLPVLLFALIGSSGRVHAGVDAVHQAGPSVDTSVNPTVVNIGETAVVSVNLNNVPGVGYASAEFTCTYGANLLEASNIVVTNLFGADAVTVISGPKNGKFILAIAGSRGRRATTSGTVVTFNVKGLHFGQTAIDCTARVSEGDHVLSDISSTWTVFTVVESIPSPSPLTPTIQPTTCDKAQFIANITVPPGTVMSPGATFLKTWRFTNVGTCSWNGTSLVFYDGTNMSTATSFQLSVSVQMGQTVDISLPMTAPMGSGSYRGFWMFMNANGELFGVGPQGNQPFSVDINVSGPTVTSAPSTNSPTPSITPGGPTVTPIPGVAFDFAANACSASWSSEAGQLPCPGIDGDAKGFVLKLDHPTLENGVVDTRPGLLTVPQNIKNGYIQGVFPPFKVQSGDRFRSIIGCEVGATSCYVVFRLDYQIGSGSINTFWAFVERYDSQYYSADLDLSPLAGQDVRFILTVLSNGSAIGDRALWVGSTIHRANAGFTPIPSATPTAIGTSTPTAIYTPTTTATDMPELTITGQVLAGKPVTVSLYNTDNSLAESVTDNSDGTFSFMAPAGTYTLVATASGYLSAQGSITPSLGSTMPTISLLAGDIDNNNVIDQFDALTIGINYNSALPTAADLNNDGVINVLDLELLAHSYRKVGPVVWQ